jgi:hypothetical protein
MQKNLNKKVVLSATISLGYFIFFQKSCNGYPKVAQIAKNCQLGHLGSGHNGGISKQGLRKTATKPLVLP